MRKQLSKGNNEYDNNRRISLWLSAENSKTLCTGQVEIDGIMYKIFLYENDRKKSDKQPDYTGNIIPESELEDRGGRSNRGGQQQRRSEPPKDYRTQPQREQEHGDPDYF